MKQIDVRTLSHAELLEHYLDKSCERMHAFDALATKYHKLRNHVVESTLPELNLSRHSIDREKPKTYVAIHKLDLEIEYLSELVMEEIK
jgi:hypothetical protein